MKINYQIGIVFKYSFVFLMLFFNIKSTTQNVFRYREVPNIFLDKLEIRKAPKDLSLAYDLINLLPTNYVKDGSVDYTSIIQKGITENKICKLPDFPILLNYRGLTLTSNTSLYFQSNSKIIISPNDSGSYAAIRIYDCENVIVYNPIVIGDRDKHLNETGQWGMGITIRGGKKINIVHPIISNCWGDGIYIGSKSQISSDVSISNGLIDNNRRNGITIASGKNINITNTLVSNSNGHMPMSGIDIEPNTNSDVLTNILLDNVITYNNAYHGLVISPGNLKGKNANNLSIKIQGHTDEYSKIGFGLALQRFHKPINGVPLKGNIKIINSTWKNNQQGFKDYGYTDKKIKVSYKNIQIFKDINGKEVLDEKEMKLIKN